MLHIITHYQLINYIDNLTTRQPNINDNYINLTTYYACGTNKGIKPPTLIEQRLQGIKPPT